MDGYSVTEAASILGVPTEKVWELIARGVLAGAQDGDRGMRVFLQGRPQPRTIDAVRATDAPPPREPDRELSPFRELLTEFRNLTERYGQALLALGEARGEVAALRSRVDLLEARMDLRLPPPPSTAPLPDARWVAPMPEPTASPEPQADVDESVAAEEPPDTGPVVEPADEEEELLVETASLATAVQIEADVETIREDEVPAGEVAADAESDVEADAEPGTEADQAPSRRRTLRWTTETFAEALARAEDPTEPELPGTQEAAAALAALREEAAVADAQLPRDTAVAEAMEGVEEAPLEASEAHSEVTAQAAPKPEPEPEPEPVAAMPEPTVEPESERRARGGPEEPPLPEPEPLDGAWDRERYTTAIEEPDWYAEIERPFEQEPTPIDGDATSGTEREGSAAPPPEPSWEEAAPDAAAMQPAEAEEASEPEPIEPQAAVPPVPAQPPAGPPDEEELTWFGARAQELSESSRRHAEEPEWPPEDGAAEMEVAGSRSSAESAFPGSPELHDALSALDALARETRAGTASPEPEQQAPPPARPAPRPPVQPSPPPWRTTLELPRPPAPRPVAPSGPASRAYRRLRRIFPG